MTLALSPSLSGSLAPSSVIPIANGGTGKASMSHAQPFGGQQIVGQHSTGILSTLSNGTDTVKTFRMGYYIPQYSYDFKLTFLNGYISAALVQTGPGNAITIKAAIEYNGQYVPATFGGSQTALVPNAGIITTDTVPLDVPAGSIIYVRVTVTVTSGQFWPMPIFLSTTQTGGSYGPNGTDSAYGTGALATASGQMSMFLPQYITASTYPKTSGAVYVTGDSIGTGSTFDLPSGAMMTANRMPGFIVRGLGWLGATPTINGYQTCQPSTTVAQRLAATNVSLLNAAISSCDYCINEGSHNDLTSGATLVQIQGYLQTYWAYFAARGIKIYQTTIPPWTASTDQWRTSTNQTIADPAKNTIRIQLNDWIRTVPSPLSGVIDIADAVEVNSSNAFTRNGSYWYCGAQIDSGTATSGTTSLLNDTTKNWVASSLVGSTVIITGGTGAGQIKTITSNNATAIGAAFTTAPDATSTYVVQNTCTGDGTHPSAYGHSLLAVPVSGISSVFVGK